MAKIMVVPVPEIEVRIVAGHRIERWSDRCVTCGRSVNDVLSSSEGAVYGEGGVACHGLLSTVELLQIHAERERRDRVGWT